MLFIILKNYNNFHNQVISVSLIDGLLNLLCKYQIISFILQYFEWLILVYRFLRAIYGYFNMLLSFQSFQKLSPVYQSPIGGRLRMWRLFRLFDNATRVLFPLQFYYFISQPLFSLCDRVVFYESIIYPCAVPSLLIQSKAELIEEVYYNAEKAFHFVEHRCFAFVK